MFTKNNRAQLSRSMTRRTSLFALCTQQGDEVFGNSALVMPKHASMRSPAETAHTRSHVLQPASATLSRSLGLVLANLRDGPVPLFVYLDRAPPRLADFREEPVEGCLVGRCLTRELAQFADRVAFGALGVFEAHANRIEFVECPRRR